MSDGCVGEIQKKSVTLYNKNEVLGKKHIVFFWEERGWLLSSVCCKIKQKWTDSKLN